ncbi:hypothetical protein HJC23_009727, partial [Cyclotella cryptica]
MSTFEGNKTNNSVEDGMRTINNCSSPAIPSEPSPLEIESETAQDSAANDATSVVLNCVFGSTDPPLETASKTSWKRSISRRVLRYSTQASDGNIEERRGVVVTPLTQENGTAMGAGRRFYGTSGEATRTSNVGCCKKCSSFLCAVINCGAISDSTDARGYNPNIWITNFFYWLFRKGWMTVVMVSLLSFYILVLLFTLIIVLWTVYADSDCVRIGGLPFGSMPHRSLFMDAFSLSWATISTVGYGSTYPALSTEHDHEGDSRWRIFAKVTRITQRAKVKFSDPLLIKFGAGVDAGLGLDDNSQNIQSSDDATNNAYSIAKTSMNDGPGSQTRSTAGEVMRPSPFPVLEFRLANELYDVAAGEIIGAQVNAVVVIEGQQDGEEVSEELAKQINNERLKRTARAKKTSLTKNPFSSVTELVALKPFDKTKHYFGNKKMKIDEEESGSSVIVPRMIFSKLSLDHSEHPFFKRLWTFRHIIDGDSPLLSTAAKQRILENGGLWPREWDSDEAISQAIRFNQIIVSFTGVSNISAASVYRQKVYDYVDLVIGYQFVNPLYRGRTGKLKVDLSLINDVVEQNGG